jgi:hypothetical protein
MSKTGYCLVKLGINSQDLQHFVQIRLDLMKKKRSSTLINKEERGLLFSVLISLLFFFVEKNCQKVTKFSKNKIFCYKFAFFLEKIFA